ncbi:MAG: energy transducer TonB [Deltaproteobacteria bacterium]|nr:energy transducer TonB [Deltaproteobacteria bacterium]
MAPKIIDRGENRPIFTSQGMVFKITFAVSLFLHAAVVFSLRDVLVLQWEPPDLRTYRIELVRPPVKDLDQLDAPGAEISGIKDRKETPPDQSEDTISLDTSDKRYVSYARAIKENILLHWRYPPEAKNALLEGKLRVTFTLDRGGSVIAIEVSKASGYDVLDQEAVRAINAASPFPPFPPHIAVNRLHINADFEYRLKRRKQ